MAGPCRVRAKNEKMKIMQILKLIIQAQGQVELRSILEASSKQMTNVLSSILPATVKTPNTARRLTGDGSPTSRSPHRHRERAPS